VLSPRWLWFTVLKLLARYNHGLLYSKTLSKWHTTLALTFLYPALPFTLHLKRIPPCVLYLFFWLEVLIGVLFSTDTGTRILPSMDNKSDTSTGPSLSWTTVTPPSDSLGWPDLDELLNFILRRRPLITPTTVNHGHIYMLGFTIGLGSMSK
jgi:hypothetical protein